PQSRSPARALPSSARRKRGCYLHLGVGDSGHSPAGRGPRLAAHPAVTDVYQRQFDHGQHGHSGRFAYRDVLTQQHSTGLRSALGVRSQFGAFHRKVISAKLRWYFGAAQLRALRRATRRRTKRPLAISVMVAGSGTVWMSLKIIWPAPPKLSIVST